LGKWAALTKRVKHDNRVANEPDFEADNEAAWSSVFNLHRATRLVLDGVLCGSFETAKIYAAESTVNEIVEVPERWGLPPKLGSLLLGMNAEPARPRRMTVAAFLDQTARDDARQLAGNLSKRRLTQEGLDTAKMERRSSSAGAVPRSRASVFVAEPMLEEASEEEEEELRPIMLSPKKKKPQPPPQKTEKEEIDDFVAKVRSGAENAGSFDDAVDLDAYVNKVTALVSTGDSFRAMQEAGLESLPGMGGLKAEEGHFPRMSKSEDGERVHTRMQSNLAKARASVVARQSRRQSQIQEATTDRIEKYQRSSVQIDSLQECMNEVDDILGGGDPLEIMPVINYEGLLDKKAEKNEIRKKKKNQQQSKPPSPQKEDAFVVPQKRKRSKTKKRTMQPKSASTSGSKDTFDVAGTKDSSSMLSVHPHIVKKTKPVVQPLSIGSPEIEVRESAEIDDRFGSVVRTLFSLLVCLYVSIIGVIQC